MKKLRSLARLTKLGVTQLAALEEDSNTLTAAGIEYVRNKVKAKHLST